MIETFFVIDDDPEYLYITRKNILSLVHYGFSREEIYFMPITEFISYIKLINEERIEVEKETQSNTNNSDKINDIKMAGNTVSRFFGI